MSGLQDGEEGMGWDVDSSFDPHDSGWADRVHATIPHIEEDEMVILRRMEKKLDSVEDVSGVKGSKGDNADDDRVAGRRGGGEGAGTGGMEVADEAEERGFIGDGDKGKGKDGD